MPVHFSSLTPEMSVFTLAISCLTTSSLDLTFQVPSYAVLFFAESDLTYITSHIHNSVLFPLWLSLFIPSGVISPLISSVILGTYQPGEFISQCHIFLPFHTVHGAFQARMLKWPATPFPSDHVSSEASSNLFFLPTPAS